MQAITPSELKPRWDTRNTEENTSILLLDVREEWEYQMVHVEGSVNIPLGKIPNIELDELPDAKEIVVICHHGMRSAQAGIILEQKGLSNVINLTGGIDAWSKEVDSSLPLY